MKIDSLVGSKVSVNAEWSLSCTLMKKKLIVASEIETILLLL